MTRIHIIERNYRELDSRGNEIRKIDVEVVTS